MCGSSCYPACLAVLMYYRPGGKLPREQITRLASMGEPRNGRLFYTMKRGEAHVDDVGEDFDAARKRSVAGHQKHRLTLKCERPSGKAVLKMTDK
jgi:hypothetical protein